LDNPYAPPASHPAVVQERGEPYTPIWFDASGRIGRLRYLVYATLPAGLLALLLPLILAIPGLAAWPGVVRALFIGAAVAVLMVMTLRRLRDLALPGWWALIVLLPLNFLLVAFLLLRPGDAGWNRYGAPPCENTTMVAAGTWIVLLTAVTGLASLFDIG
jgi:uncharacterized membrane protein YhaH (DUF805 family)